MTAEVGSDSSAREKLQVRYGQCVQVVACKMRATRVQLDPERSFRKAAYGGSYVQIDSAAVAKTWPRASTTKKQ